MQHTLKKLLLVLSILFMFAGTHEIRGQYTYYAC